MLLSNLKRKAAIRSDVCKWTPCLRMALKILPILYLNLGGEMMYIIDQRLIAQKVPSDKSSKGNTCHCGKFWLDRWSLWYHSTFSCFAVMNDIAGTMFNKKFLLEIFLKNQPIQSLSMLRAMFDKLAHASVMRLNTSSMDKVSQIEHYT